MWFRSKRYEYLYLPNGTVPSNSSVSNSKQNTRFLQSLEIISVVCYYYYKLALIATVIVDIIIVITYLLT